MFMWTLGHGARRGVFAALALIGVLIAACGMGRMPAYAQPSSLVAAEARVAYADGDVSLFTTGSPAGASPGEDAVMVPGDKITTGEDSSVMLLLPDRSTLKIGEHASVTLVSVKTAAAGPPTHFKVSQGSAWANVEKWWSQFANGSSTFQVETPDALAAVHGTVFDVDASGIEGTEVNVWEGTVDVSDGTSQVRSLGPQQRIRAIRRRFSGPSQAFTANDADAWQQWNRTVDGQWNAYKQSHPARALMNVRSLDPETRRHLQKFRAQVQRGGRLHPPKRARMAERVKAERALQTPLPPKQSPAARPTPRPLKPRLVKPPVGKHPLVRKGAKP